jgi:hypothetical protein
VELLPYIPIVWIIIACSFMFMFKSVLNLLLFWNLFWFVVSCLNPSYFVSIPF